MQTLSEFLKQRAERGYRQLLTQIEGLSPKQALWDRHPQWQDHRWGIGQNGSIAGIVYHVAAWKQMTLPLFQPGGKALTREEFNTAGVPSPDDWPGIAAWFTQAGQNWQAALAALPDAAFDETRDWEGATLTLAQLVVEMYEHDVQHSSQIEYLRNRLESGEPLTGPIRSELLDYVRDLFAPEDEALRSLTRAAHEAGMPVGWEISPDVGRLFQTLCRAVGAKRVVEFGTLAGHSALWFARALPEGGKVLSIEINPDYAAVARDNLARAGVGEKVEVRVGAGREMLPELEREIAAGAPPFDVIFLDADKAHYPQFLDWSTRVLRPGGLILADNVLRSDSWKGQTLLDPASDDPRILAIREFNRLLATHPQFTATIVPLRAGVAVGVFEPQRHRDTEDSQR